MKPSRLPAILRPLRERDYALFWTGWTVSLLGDGFFYVAIAWQVYDLWNTPSALAIVGVAETVPLVALLLIGGVVTDRVERRRVLIGSSLLRGACVGLLGALALTGSLRLWQIFVISGFYGIGQAFQGPAAGAIIPDLVPADLFVQANSLSQLVRQFAFRLVGPAAGGLVVHALGAGAAFLADAGSFAFAVAMLSLLSSRPAALQTDEGSSSLREDIREGFRFVRSHVWLWGTLVWATCALLLTYGPFEVLVPYVVKNELGGSAGDLGLVFAAGGLGAVIASLGIGQLGLPGRHMTVMYAVWALGTFDLVLYTVARKPLHAMLIALFAEACWVLGQIVWATLMQRLVPRELFGRVKSIDWLLSIGLAPVSFALTGPLAAWLGADAVLVAAGLGGGLLTVLFFCIPGMRDTERDGNPARVVLSQQVEAA